MNGNGKEHCAKSRLYAIYNVKGITLTTLVVTIVVLLILAGVATFSGIEAIDNSKRTKFIAELKIMQSYVNQWYEDCKPNNVQTWSGNIEEKFSGSGAIWIGSTSTDDSVKIDKAKNTLTVAGITLSTNNFYYLSSSTLNFLGVEGVSQDVLVSIQDRKVVSYLGLQYKGNMYYTIDSLDGENGIDAIYNVGYDESILKPDESRPIISVTGRSVYWGDTAKNAKYKFTVAVTQGSDYINKGELYYGKKENGSVKNWIKTEDTTFQVDRDGTYQFRYIDAAGNESVPIDYVIEPKATLIDGPNFNKKMKALSGTSSPGTSTNNNNIVEFKVSDTKPSSLILGNTNNLVSTNNSKYPIYMWFENGTIYLWSEENWIGFNSNSNEMFRQLLALKTANFMIFDTKNVTTMNYTFHSCNNLTDLNVSSFNTSNVTTMYQMFYGCVKLKSLDLNNFDTTNVFNMGEMFNSCQNLENLDVSKFNTQSTVYMGAMFNGCKKLKEINVSNFCTKNVQEMQYMFAECNELTILNLESFNTQKVNNIASMFRDSNNIITIYVSEDFILKNGINSYNMFKGCLKIVGGNGTTYNASNVNADYARIDYIDTEHPENSKPGYFTRKPTI